MNGTIELLRREIAGDRTAFEERIDELADLGLSAASDANVVARAAVALHHGYGALESALARLTG